MQKVCCDCLAALLFDLADSFILAFGDVLSFLTEHVKCELLALGVESI